MKMLNPTVRDKLVSLVTADMFDEPLRATAAVLIDRRPSPRTRAQLVQALKSSGLPVPELPDKVDLTFDLHEIRKLVQIREIRTRYLAEIEEIEGSNGFNGTEDSEDNDLTSLNKVKPRTGIVATGIAGLDSLLDGGLGKEELGILMGPANSGKSSIVAWLIKYALSKSLRVMYLTLDQSEALTRMRVLACMTGFTASQMAADKKIARRVTDLSTALSKKGGFLKVRSECNQGMSVAELGSYVRRLDLNMLCIDPGDNLRRPRNLGEPRLENTEIWQGIKDLTVEAGLPIWATTQSNRASYETGRVKMNNAAENIAKMQIADVVVTINALSANQISLLLAKNRFGPKDVETAASADWVLSRFVTI